MKAATCIALTIFFAGLGWMLGSTKDHHAELSPVHKESQKEQTPNAEALIAPHLASAKKAKQNGSISRTLNTSSEGMIKSTDPFGKQMKDATALMSRFYKPAEVKSRAMDLVCEATVNDAIAAISKDHPSLRAAIRNGKLKTNDVLTFSRKQYSIHHQAANETMALKYFAKFSSYDFSFALGFLEGIDPTAKEQALVNQCNKTLAQIGDAFRLYDVLSKHPIESGQPLNNRFGGPWRTISLAAYERYADYYPKWLIQLPAGVDRDMALSALAYQIREQQPEYCEELLSHKAGGGK